MRLIICFVIFTEIIFGTVLGLPTPVVLWHGMGDTCCNRYSMAVFGEFISQQVPGIYVRSIRVGNSTIDDLENGFFMNPNDQIDFVCKELAQDHKLSNGFNAIGFSQGSQFLRGMVQRCGHKLPPVKNLISFGGQHQGVYGLPHCFAMEHKTCDYLREVLNFAAYKKYVQRSLVQATYWHDPLHEQNYKEGSIFLSDINNELRINETYKNNLLSLEHFVMVKFENDSMVQPRESEWFGFYKPGQGSELQTLQESQIYLEDRLGLQKMDKAGKLVFISEPGDHLHFNSKWIIKNIIIPYLLD